MQVRKENMQNETRQRFTKVRIRNIVADAVACVSELLAMSINDETVVSDEDIDVVTQAVSNVMGLAVVIRNDEESKLGRREPKRGWKVSRLVGYIFAEQDKFQRLT